MILSLVQNALTVAAQVKDPVAAAVFALVIACAAFWFALKKKDKTTVLSLGLLLGAGIIILGALPLLARTYLNTHGIYEVRVVVLGVDQSPVEDSVVICSPGGEQKRIAGGWECDIPPRNRPGDRIVTAYAKVESAFLTGVGQLRLSDDYNPVLTIRMQSDHSATVEVKVEDRDGVPLSGAWVSVLGYETERVRTGSSGGFRLPAHAPSGQMIRLRVAAKRFHPYEALEQAGDNSISIQLAP